MTEHVSEYLNRIFVIHLYGMIVKYDFILEFED